MKLTKEQIEAIATGVAYSSYTEEGRVTLHRFTPEEENLYLEKKPNFYSKVFCTSGMKLSFITDSEKLGIKGYISGGTTRNYMAIQVFCDGKEIGIHTNYSHLEIPKLYVGLACDLGLSECCFSLGGGEHHVEVYLPWSIQFDFEEITLDDGAKIIPKKRDKLLLAYGDSITQGYDALKPYNRYSSLVAEALSADEHNKAIGGEIFFPDLAKNADRNLKPDYITVAYGTNDWNGRRDTELFVVHVKEFFAALADAYPETPIFALMPIWRKDVEDGERPLGSLEGLAEKIADYTKDIPTVTVIKGYDVVPECEDLYADLRLHPNDEGYVYQAKGFTERIKACLG